jgi:hypothetical protein
MLVAAAILHDVGYAPDLATTGFHPLDAARVPHRPRRGPSIVLPRGAALVRDSRGGDARAAS